MNDCEGAKTDFQEWLRMACFPPVVGGRNRAEAALRDAPPQLHLWIFYDSVTMMSFP